MASISVLNPKADILRKSVAFAANFHAAKGLQKVIKSNLGPRGTLKMLVGGGGQIKVTKDGCVLLNEMQIQHPTASMIARAATAQDDISGDGTTSIVIIIGEILKQAERFVTESVHPQLLCEGIDIGRKALINLLDEVKSPISYDDREMLQRVAQTSLRTKLSHAIADSLSDIVTDAVLIVLDKESHVPVDLHMVEVLPMKHGLTSETRLIRGMVLDHGARHPDMPKDLRKCFILTLNVSLEYEKSEVTSSFMYSSAVQRERLVEAERAFTDEKVRRIIELKRKVCELKPGSSFVVLNQKGIDPPSLSMLAQEDILALRRVKRRNMERLTLACGGNAMNSVEDLSIEDLGWADHVYEKSIGEDKFTFIEGVNDCKSCCILIIGPNDHSITQVKDAIRDGLRAVKNAIDDKYIIPGAGAFELMAYQHLQNIRKEVHGKSKFGVDILAEAFLAIPKTLAENAALDPQEITLNTLDALQKSNQPLGIDLTTGEPFYPIIDGVIDNYCVKRQILSIAPTLAQQLLLVDEVIKAGKQMQ
ncbi:TCP-1 CPN60 chaperonin family protein [Cryptosporidium andersoni]|uniref:TCP-1 CPN60 chaperonin family protein n=1 Tax=Cryptosporidium andersoni TaxID=117008 RepID=A0A1J4ME87_9CRYT|nr:TCP-1 CPN60 chaperonin family protein [Cryptosporidium andersoni]